jgi:glutathione S-transferase
MGLTVWGRPRAANVQKVMWCLAELGTEFTQVSDTAAVAGARDAAYLGAVRKPPLVPVLDDDGFVLWEANAAVRYLAETRGSAPFWPATPQLRADAGRWMDYQLSTIRGYIHPLLRDAPSADETARYAKLLARGMSVLEATLATQSYLVGNDFTVGDIPMAIVTFRWRLLDIERPDTPNIDAWMKRLGERPAFQRWVNPPLETSTALRA